METMSQLYVEEIHVFPFFRKKHVCCDFAFLVVCRLASEATFKFVSTGAKRVESTANTLFYGREIGQYTK